MMNMLCSPELSFNSKVENQPTAYVSYSDEEKDIVPVHFIYKFPEDWRRKKWRTNYLFKVFWSPIPDDSPSKMLQRVPTIPVFEVGAARNHAGYHRAAVLLVKESEAELLQALETGKRISVGLTKYKFTSFDEGKSKSQAMAHDKVQQQRNAAPALKKNGKPVVLKNKVKDSNTKVKAKVKKADQPATTKLRESLKRRYVESSDKDGTEDSHLGTLDFKVAIKESEKAPARSSEDAKSKRSKGELASISERAVKFGLKEKSAAAAIELQSGLDKDIKSNEIFDKVETVTIEETAVTPTKNGLFASPSKDMSFSDEKSNQLSRDHDARSKHANESLGDLNVGLKAEDEMSTQSDSDIEKGSDSNQIPGGEDDSSDKEDDDDDDLNSTAPIEPLPVIKTQTSADRLNCSSSRSVVRQVFPDSDITSTDSDDKKTLKLDPDYTPCKYVRAKEDLSIQRTTIKRLSTLNLKHQEKILELEGENEKLTSSLQRVQAEFEKFKAKCKCSKQGTSYHPASNPHPNVVSKTVPDSVKPHSKFKDDRKSSHGGSKINKITLIKVKKENSDSSSDDDKEDINAGAKYLCNTEIHVDGEKSKEEEDCDDMWPAGVSSDLKNMVLKIPEGIAKDVKFIKKSTISIFGPEVLASSSIKGTKKGSKRKGEETKTPKPPLDKSKLDAIHALLVKRVMTEEKIGEHLAKEHERCCWKRINGAIRDAQKWCREKGYGSGEKGNSVDVTLFAVKKEK